MRLLVMIGVGYLIQLVADTLQDVVIVFAIFFIGMLIGAIEGAKEI